MHSGAGGTSPEDDSAGLVPRLFRLRGALVRPADAHGCLKLKQLEYLEDLALGAGFSAAETLTQRELPERAL